MTVSILINPTRSSSAPTGCQAPLASPHTPPPAHTGVPPASTQPGPPWEPLLFGLLLVSCSYTVQMEHPPKGIGGGGYMGPGEHPLL